MHGDEREDREVVLILHKEMLPGPTPDLPLLPATQLGRCRKYPPTFPELEARDLSLGN